MSAVIVNWNGGRDLLHCIESLLAQGWPELEVIVVDNASTDGSADRAAEKFPQVSIVRHSRNLGYAKGANAGVARSSGEFVLLLNPDVRLRQGALRKLADFASSRPEAGVVGPKILNPDGSLQYSCRRFPNLPAAFLRHTPLEAFLPRHRYLRHYLMLDFDHDSVREVDWVSGACMFLRRRALEEVGGFDEKFFLYCEDMDLCLRMRGAGWRVFYFPHAEAVHATGSSSWRRPFASVFHAHRSMWLFYRKYFRHPSPWVDLIIAWGMMGRVITVLFTLALKRLFRGRPKDAVAT